MSEARSVRVLTSLGLGLIAVTLAFAGYWLLFTTFMEYDDEGYVLISLRNYALHGGLYDQVYTQYGPFFYLLYDGLHRLFGFAFDNTSGRWITLFNWLGTAVACAALVARTTRSVLWGAFTLVGTFTYLWIMVHEPMHPGGLITMIVALVAWLGAEAWANGKIGRFTAVTGISCAALLLTKINVGAFLLGAVVAWFLLNASPTPRTRLLQWLFALGCAVLPIVLMWSLLDRTWVRAFVIVFSAAAIGSFVAARQLCRSVISGRRWIELLAWFIGTCVVVCSISILRGTNLHGLIEGVVIEPLKHPGVYFYPVIWSGGALAVTVGALVSLSLALGTARFSRWENRRVLQGVAAVRIAAGVYCLAALLDVLPITLAGCGLSYGISLAWCFVIPLDGDRKSAGIRAWVAIVLVFQSLQVYPVAGSQLNWGTFLWIPLLALGLHDVVGLFSRANTRAFRWTYRAAMAGAALVTVFSVSKLTATGWHSFGSAQCLGLKGAENLRLPNDLTQSLRVVNENLRAHADLLFSYPGLYSANLWTEIPTPTLANATHWFSLLSPVQQQEVIAELSARPRAMMLVQRDVLKYLGRHGFKTAGPLHDWILEHFEKALAFGGYELWVRTGRTIAGYSTARADRGPHGVLEKLTLTVHGLRAPLVTVDLCNIDRPKVPLITFSQANSLVTVVPCGPDGKALETPLRTRFPVTEDRPALITVHFAPIQVSAKFDRLDLVLRGPGGEELGEFVIAD